MTCTIVRWNQKGAGGPYHALDHRTGRTVCGRVPRGDVQRFDHHDMNAVGCSMCLNAGHLLNVRDGESRGLPCAVVPA